MEEAELGVAEGGGGVLALKQFAVKRIHQLRGGGVAHFPEGANDVVRAGAQKRPGEANEAFAGIGARPCAVASRDGDKLRVETVGDDIARIKFVSVAFRGSRITADSRGRVILAVPWVTRWR